MPEINVNEEDKVVLSIRVYKEMLDDLKFLACLRAAGVDNWEGYEIAQEYLEDDE